MRRPQFTLRALLKAMMVVAAFFAGTQFERERQRRADAIVAYPENYELPACSAGLVPTAPARSNGQHGRESV